MKAHLSIYGESRVHRLYRVTLAEILCRFGRHDWEHGYSFGRAIGLRRSSHCWRCGDYRDDGNA